MIFHYLVMYLCSYQRKWNIRVLDNWSLCQKGTNSNVFIIWVRLLTMYHIGKCLTNASFPRFKFSSSIKYFPKILRYLWHVNWIVIWKNAICYKKNQETQKKIVHIYTLICKLWSFHDTTIISNYIYYI